MTAPAPRADGKPRLQVHKVGKRWNVDTGHNTLVLYSDPNYPAALHHAAHLAGTRVTD